jgi:hypothetical protein
MRSPRLYVALILCVLGSVLLTGCFRSTLPPLEYPQEAQRLLSVPDAQMTLRLQVEEPSGSVGNQFLFGLLPLTRVYTPHIERDIATHLAIEAATRRYKLRTELHGSTAQTPHITVIVRELHVSGYDLIFVRRPSASVTLTGILELPKQSPRRCEAHVESAATTRFAFSTELNTVLQEALTASSRELFDCLRL